MAQKARLRYTWRRSTPLQELPNRLRVTDMTSDKKTGAARARPARKKTGLPAEAEHQRVAKADENFEHTLRRAAIERELQRARNPGLYR